MPHSAVDDSEWVLQQAVAWGTNRFRTNTSANQSGLANQSGPVVQSGSACQIRPACQIGPAAYQLTVDDEDTPNIQFVHHSRSSAPILVGPAIRPPAFGFIIPSRNNKIHLVSPNGQVSTACRVTYLPRRREIKPVQDSTLRRTNRQNYKEPTVESVSDDEGSSNLAGLFNDKRT